MFSCKISENFQNSYSVENMWTVVSDIKLKDADSHSHFVFARTVFKAYCNFGSAKLVKEKLQKTKKMMKVSHFGNREGLPWMNEAGISKCFSRVFKSFKSLQNILIASSAL